ncbi:MAG: ATP-binding protein, partial [Bacteroidales bacterium]|nr:ATP-binding protein [Bacteroidales bacterium]
PCPCGYYNHPEKQCVCSPAQVKKYLNRISGPLLDRIDIHVEVVPVPFKDLSVRQLSESSADIRKRVVRAREIQQQRFADSPKIHCNAQMSSSKIRTFCQIDDSGMILLKNAMEKLGLSARAYDRILKVSRTIADLAEEENIKPEHIAEAIQYRSLDRENWGM